MPTITQLKPLYVSKVRTQVYLEEEHVFTLHKGTVKELGWKQGQEVSAQLPDAAVQSECDRAFSLALWLLERTDKSQMQMREYLRRREYLPQAIEFALKKLTEYRIVDDTRLAESVVRAGNRQQLSRRAVQQKLRAKGVDALTAQSALQDWDARAEREAATKLAAQYLRKYQAQDARERKRKAAAALQRKGFDWETISAALRLAMEDMEGEDETNV